MSIFKSFIWMFETDNFWKRVKQLFLIVILLYILSILCYFAGKIEGIGYIAKQVFYLGSILSVTFSWLILQGYFWNLTSNVISRDVDIVANNVYSGKIKNVYTIHLPEFKPIKFLWRGFASVVASILMVLPYSVLVFSTIFTASFSMPWDNIQMYHRIYTISYNLLYLFFFLFMPALLWNYAKQNSVVAVWNIPKAVYIVENYFLNYVGHTVIFILFYMLNCAVLLAIFKLFGNTVMYLASGILYIYSLHVYAYLLGTITPVSEG